MTITMLLAGGGRLTSTSVTRTTPAPFPFDLWPSISFLSDHHLLDRVLLLQSLGLSICCISFSVWTQQRDVRKQKISIRPSRNRRKRSGQICKGSDKRCGFDQVSRPFTTITQSFPSGGNSYTVCALQTILIWWRKPSKNCKTSPTDRQTARTNITRRAMIEVMANINSIYNKARIYLNGMQLVEATNCN